MIASEEPCSLQDRHEVKLRELGTPNGKTVHSLDRVKRINNSDNASQFLTSHPGLEIAS